MHGRGWQCNSVDNWSRGGIVVMMCAYYRMSLPPEGDVEAKLPMLEGIDVSWYLTRLCWMGQLAGRYNIVLSRRLHSLGRTHAGDYWSQIFAAARRPGSMGKGVMDCNALTLPRSSKDVVLGCMNPESPVSARGARHSVRARGDDGPSLVRRQ